MTLQEVIKNLQEFEKENPTAKFGIYKIGLNDFYELHPDHLRYNPKTNQVHINVL